MLEKDLRPTRYELMLNYACEFVTEYFEQNPISQLGVIGMRDGLAVRISDLSGMNIYQQGSITLIREGNPHDSITAIQNQRKKEPQGNPSLQNALEMARASL